MLAGDINRTIGLINDAWEDTIDKDLWSLVDSWLSLLSEEVINKSVSLLVARFYVAFKAHRLGEVFQSVEMIERIGNQLSGKEKGYFSFAKSIISYYTDTPAKSMKYVIQALKFIPKKYHSMVRDAWTNWFLSMLATGQHDEALRVTEDNTKKFYMKGNNVLLAGSRTNLGYYCLLHADLKKLRSATEEMDKSPGLSNFMLAFNIYNRAFICWWRNDPEGVVREIEPIFALRYDENSRQVVDCYICKALALQDLNRPADATMVINEAMKFAQHTQDPGNISVTSSGAARLNLVQGNLRAAEEWLYTTEHSGLDLSMLWWLEVPAMTRCRVLIASGSPEGIREALELLKEYQEYSESMHNKMRTIETVLLQTQAYLRIESEGEAVKNLTYALELTSPGEWIRPFVEIGDDIAELLPSLKNKVEKPGFIDSILSELKKRKSTPSVIKTEPEPVEVLQISEEMIESISIRERQILKLIADGFRNKEIANKFCISPETVKKHVHNLFRKLNVGSRIRAVEKARDINLI